MPDISSLASFSRDVSLSIYTENALKETQAAFQDFCTTTSERLTDSLIRVTVRPILSSNEKAKSAILEFWNYYLDKSCDERLNGHGS